MLDIIKTLDYMFAFCTNNRGDLSIIDVCNNTIYFKLIGRFDEVSRFSFTEEYLTDVSNCLNVMEETLTKYINKLT